MRRGWHSERRTKASIAYPGLMKTDERSLRSPSDVFGLTSPTPEDHEAEHFENEILAAPQVNEEEEEDEEDRPGAYAISRRVGIPRAQRSIRNIENEWDPTAPQDPWPGRGRASPSFRQLQRAAIGIPADEESNQSSSNVVIPRECSRPSVIDELPPILDHDDLNDSSVNDSITAEVTSMMTPNHEAATPTNSIIHMTKKRQFIHSRCWPCCGSKSTLSSSSMSRSRAWIPLLLLLASLVVGITGAVVYVRSRDNQNDDTSKSKPRGDCDFVATNQQQPDPFIQCNCFTEIRHILPSVESTYFKIRRNIPAFQQVDSGEPITSCTPGNLALFWIATEVESGAYDAPTVGGDNGMVLERFVLALLYSAWSGSRWLEKDIWLQPGSVCQWHGVGCKDGMNVSSLVLQHNQLRGTIPTAIGLMTNLELLAVSGNNLHGEIPIELWTLPKLETLECKQNSIEGTLPKEFATSSSLRRVIIWENTLRGSLPSEISETGLVELMVHDNALTGTIPELAPNFEVFWVGINKLEGTLPSNLTSLSKLSQFDVTRNQIVGSLPEDIGVMTSLTELEVANNALTGSLPSTLFRLTNLESLGVGFNAMQSTIPTEIGLLTKLEHFIGSWAKFSSTIPTELGRLTLLRILHMSSNLLVGTVPTELERLSRLEQFVLFDNDLSGDAEFLCNLSNPEKFAADCSLSCSCCECFHP